MWKDRKEKEKKKRLKSWWICWLRTLRPGMDSTRRMRISVASQLILMIHHKSAASSKSKLSAPSKGPVCKTGSREREQTRVKQQKKRKFRSSASVAWNTLHETIGRRKKPSRAAVKKKPNCKRFLCLWHGRSTAPTREEEKKAKTIARTPSQHGRAAAFGERRKQSEGEDMKTKQNNTAERTWRKPREWENGMLRRAIKKKHSPSEKLPRSYETEISHRRIILERALARVRRGNSLIVNWWQLSFLFAAVG